MNKNIITIIPARGGSKGVHKKNLRLLNGEPLITHSIKYSNECKLVNAIYVSTDDDEIASIASNSGALIVNRPTNISGDEATTESAIEHLLSTLTFKPDIIVLLQATSPLRPKNSLTEALNKFIKNNFDSMLSISPTHRFYWNIDKNNNLIPKYNFLKRKRRQDLKKSDTTFVENGSLYIFTYDHFKKVKNRLGGSIGYFEFNEKYSYEIDTETDFILLENLMKNETN